MPKYVTGTSACANWTDSLLNGRAPVIFDVGGPDWSGFELGPGSITLVGGAPGAGKTALTTQLTFEAVLRNPGLRAVIASVEMSPSTLLDRQLARLTGYSATDVRFRRIKTEDNAVHTGLATLQEAADRIAFMQAPFDMDNIADTADAFGATLFVLDYVQRFVAPEKSGGLRESMGAIMSRLREFAELGAAVLAVSAVARGRGESGATYDRQALGLASFRESSELEYGADAAWMLTKDDSGVHFSCLKNRHGDTPELLLDFDRTRQSFSVVPQIAALPPSGRPERRPTRAELRGGLERSWAKAETAPVGEGEVAF